MDLRAYYKKVREIESTLPQPFVVVVSTDTSDGGKSGVFTEVATLMAAKHIAEGRAREATAKERDGFHENNRKAKLAAEKAAAIKQMNFVVVPSNNGSPISEE